MSDKRRKDLLRQRTLINSAVMHWLFHQYKMSTVSWNKRFQIVDLLLTKHPNLKELQAFNSSDTTIPAVIPSPLKSITKWTVSIQIFRKSRSTLVKPIVEIQSLEFLWKGVIRKHIHAHYPTSSLWKIIRHLFLVWEWVQVLMEQWQTVVQAAMLEDIRGLHRIRKPILAVNS